MAGTRTAPLFTATASRRNITLRLIDASGDLYSETLPVAVSATSANIEAWASAYASASNASLYAIIDSQERIGDADPDNAVVAQRNSAKDGINSLYKVPSTGEALTTRLIAPIPAVMQGNQDIPLLSATEMTALITAYLALLTGFSFSSAQYTERRERKNNPKVK